MTRAGVLLPLVFAVGCYDWSVPGAVSTDAGPPEATDAAIVGDGLVAFWRFEESPGAPVVDSSGHGNDGVAFGGVGRAQGRVGTAATFNGQDAFIHVADNGSLAFPRGFTIAMWMNVDARSYDQVIIVTFQTLHWKLNTRHPQISVGTGFASLERDLPAGAWHHVAFTYDGGTAVGFYDGAKDAFGQTTMVPTPNPTITSGGVNIGASYQASSPPAERTEQPYFVAGALDEIRIYDRALSAGEIARIFSGS